MKHFLPLILLLVASACMTAEPRPFDRTLAIELARSQLQAYFRAHPTRQSHPIDWASPIVAAAIDGNDRSFVFVGFKSLGSSSGASLILESCYSAIDLQPSWYGWASDVDQDLRNFKSVQNNPDADYPGSCPDPE